MRSREGLPREHALASVGAGWRPLVERLYDAKPDDVEVLQVKEKFGGLRFYTGAAPAEYDALVDEMEGLSLETCERCGQPGKLDDSFYWLLTLCDTCREQRRARRT